MSSAIAPMRPDLESEWRRRKVEQLQNEWLKRVLYGEATDQDRSELAAIAIALGIDPELLFAGTGEPGHDPRTGPTMPAAVYDPEVHVYTSEDPTNWHRPDPAFDEDQADDGTEVTSSANGAEDAVDGEDVVSDLVEVAHRNPATARRLVRLVRSRLAPGLPMASDPVPRLGLHAAALGTAPETPPLLLTGVAP